MIIHDCDQGTIQWLKLHVGIPTASGLSNLLTPEFKHRDGEMPKSYMFSKLAEAWRGEPLIELNTFSTEQGLVLETEARAFYSLLGEKKVKQVGFVTTDDGLCGCSPDGLIGDDNGFEMKCPSASVHVKYLVQGTLPKDYAAQVHCSMFVTDRPKWTFFSYRRNFPPFILEIHRDETIDAIIQEAVNRFHAALNEAKEKIKRFA